MLRFPQHTKKYRVTTLGLIAEIIDERVGNKKVISLSVTSGKGLVSQKEKFGREISGNQLKHYFVIRKGDFAYNKSATKLYPEGYIALLKEWGFAAVPNSIFTCFRISDSNVIPQYLDYLFQKNYHGKWLKKFIEVGARAHGSLSVSDDSLLSIPLLLPLKAEQQKIADFLSSLDDLISAETQKLEVLKLHKKGLMQQLFPREGEKVPKLRFEEFRGSGEWREKSLDAFCELNPPIKSLPNYFYYIDLESVEKGSLLKKNKISLDSAPSRAQRLLQPEDILFQMVRPYQQNNLFFKLGADNGLPFVASTGYAQIRAYESAVFLYQYLHSQTVLDQVLENCTGSNYPAINSTSLAKLNICVPKLEEQNKVGEFLATIDEEILNQNFLVDMLTNHKKGLLQQLFPE